jgi:hypothetical protein
MIGRFNSAGKHERAELSARHGVALTPIAMCDDHRADIGGIEAQETTSRSPAGQPALARVTG